MFVGFANLGDTLHFALQSRVGDLPTDGDDFPSFRVFSGSALLPNAGGQATNRQTGVITAASLTSPIVITSNAHGLATGMQVTVAGVGGNTAANGQWTITVIDPNTFSLNGSVGNNIYTGGGVWSTTGFYDIALVATGANGFQQGQTYTVQASYTIGGIAYSQVFSVGVV